MISRRHFITSLAAIPCAAPALARPLKWAQGLPGDNNLPNLFQVTPNLFRSGQPTRKGFGAARKNLGIQTVINLRNDRDDGKDAQGLGLNLVYVPMSAWNAADEDNPLLARAIHEVQIATSRGKTLVHCQYGADRTGAVMAVWRIIGQGWSKDAAIAEMRGGGYHYHELFLHIGAEIRKLNIDKLRQQIAAL